VYCHMTALTLYNGNALKVKGKILHKKARDESFPLVPRIVMYRFNSRA